MGGRTIKKPEELIATEKNQVWMWDITWLKTDVKGIYKYAYVIEDQLIEGLLAGQFQKDYKTDREYSSLGRLPRPSLKPKSNRPSHVR